METAGERGPQESRRAAFPRALLQRLQALAPAASVLRVALWNGELLLVERLVEQDAHGLIGELGTERPGSEEGQGLVALPWAAIARIEAVPQGAARRIRPGFSPPGAAS